MLKDNEKNFSRLHMIIDAIVLVLSYFLAWLIRFVGPMAATAVRTRSFQQYMLMLVFIVPVYLLLYQAFTLYTPMRMQGRRLVLANIVKANSLGLLILMFDFRSSEKYEREGTESETDDLCGIQPRSRGIH